MRWCLRIPSFLVPHVYQFRSFRCVDQHARVVIRRYSIVTYGKKMCGHRGILHGGASGSTLDQFFGLMICLQKINGFTGQLNVSYRKIVLCPSTILIKGTLDRTENRKHYFKATIYDGIGDVCVEADCLFIQSDIKKVLDRALAKLEEKKCSVCWNCDAKHARFPSLKRPGLRKSAARTARSA